MTVSTPGPASSGAPASRQAFLYLQASIIGTLANFVIRFPLAELVGFEASVVLSTYLGMALVFALSYRRAFGIRHPDLGMALRFVLVAHIGLVTVWLVSTTCYTLIRLISPQWLDAQSAGQILPTKLCAYASWIPRLAEGGCHALGIIAGFFVNFLGHRNYSFRRRTPDAGNCAAHSTANPDVARVFAVLIPLSYAALYAPPGMDGTDFGFFYGYAWHILQGEVPFVDFYYTKPPASLYWHAFWMWMTPDKLTVLGGKLGFLAEMLGASWFGALLLNRAFDLPRLGLSLPLLATLGFVFGVHTFPPMPWHTADGVLFGSACLYAAAAGLPLLSGLLGALVILTKQSFLFVPLAAACVAFCLHSGRKALFTLLTTAAALLATGIVFKLTGIWEPFLRMTTGGLSLAEALEAGIKIYFIPSEWKLPGLVLLHWCVIIFVLRRLGRKTTLTPVFLYFPALAVWYAFTALGSKEWIGFGTSWPTLFLIMGGVEVLLPRIFLNAWALAPKTDAANMPTFKPFDQETLPTAHLQTQASHDCALPQAPAVFLQTSMPLATRLRPAVVLGAALLLSWSTAISGGYKIPAFFSVPLLFAALLLHKRLGGHVGKLAWLALACGLLMFRTGYEYPYVFPQRDMPRSGLVHDAGAIFPKLSGVLVDQQMLETLSELKNLRAKYGPNYKTLPAFPLAYLLTSDKPVLPVEWLQDWELAGDTEEVYQMLVDRDIVVFFERNQLDTLSPDGYARTRYTVPARVRREWRQVDETKHFVVFKKP